MQTGALIKARRKELGISADEIAVALQIDRSTVFRYEKGDIEKLPISVLEPLAGCLHTTPAYLMGWTQNPEPTAASNGNEIPILGKIACGSPILAEENITQRISLPSGITADFALLCKGDSMTDAGIDDGDTVYIHRQPSVENGEIAAILIGEEATLKRVHLENNTLTLLPANPAYPPFVYVGEEICKVQVIGKATGVLKRL